jgi:hypothetical protein
VARYKVTQEEIAARYARWEIRAWMDAESGRGELRAIHNAEDRRLQG